MKIYQFLGLIGLGTAVVACSDDNLDKTNPVAPDDEVEFLVNTSSVSSRTMYGQENAEGTQQGLYWGNYNDWVADTIKIFSNETRFGYANYLIQKAETNSNTAAGITRLGEYGLQWGAQPDDLNKTYDFYAFYPASRCQDDVTYTKTDTEQTAIVNAWIRPGQSPTKINATPVTENGTEVYYGNPDMRACLMSAHNTAKYGETVSLDFKPLATVLDITINGNANMNEPEAVYMVSLRHKKGEAIVGNFQYDMHNNKIVEGSITNGESQISMIPRISTYDADHNPTSSTTVMVKPKQQLKVRFFLIPRKDISICNI